MFDKKNEYALNISDKNDIVYQDTFGKLIRITPDQLSGIKEFRKWKDWAKMKAHTTEKKEHIHRNHTVSLSDQENRNITTQGIEEALFEQESILSHQQNALEQVQTIRQVLTDKQFQRL